MRAGGDAQKALTLFRKAADTRSRADLHRAAVLSASGRRRLANTALALGDAVTAEKGYREALAREPGSGRAFFGLAAALQAQGRRSKAGLHTSAG